MKTTDAMPITGRPRGIGVAALFAAGVVLIAVSGGVLVRDLRSESTTGTTPVRIETAVTPVQGWGWLLRADTAQVLRHRPGLEPADLVRTHAFGWTGPTEREIRRNPVLMRELRLQPSLTQIDLIRLEA